VAVSKDCLAHLECPLVYPQKEGDHTIFIVEQVGVREGRPLLFSAARYRKLEPDAPEEEQF
jgi:flavin reductase (DIM6/NTAB) family NADH-FMN oxidoreductase RutF